MKPKPVPGAGRGGPGGRAPVRVRLRGSLDGFSR